MMLLVVKDWRIVFFTNRCRIIVTGYIAALLCLIDGEFIRCAVKRLLGLITTIIRLLLRWRSRRKLWAIGSTKSPHWHRWVTYCGRNMALTALDWLVFIMVTVEIGTPIFWMNEGLSSWWESVVRRFLCFGKIGIDWRACTFSSKLTNYLLTYSSYYLVKQSPVHNPFSIGQFTTGQWRKIVLLEKGCIIDWKAWLSVTWWWNCPYSSLSFRLAVKQKADELSTFPLPRRIKRYHIHLEYNVSKFCIQRILKEEKQRKIKNKQQERMKQYAFHRKMQLHVPCYLLVSFPSLNSTRCRSIRVLD